MNKETPIAKFIEMILFDEGEEVPFMGSITEFAGILVCCGFSIKPLGKWYFNVVDNRGQVRGVVQLVLRSNGIKYWCKSIPSEAGNTFTPETN